MRIFIYILVTSLLDQFCSGEDEIDSFKETNLTLRTRKKGKIEFFYEPSVVESNIKFVIDDFRMKSWKNGKKTSSLSGSKLWQFHDWSVERMSVYDSYFHWNSFIYFIDLIGYKSVSFFSCHFSFHTIFLSFFFRIFISSVQSQ